MQDSSQDEVPLLPKGTLDAALTVDMAHTDAMPASANPLPQPVKNHHRRLPIHYEGVKLKKAPQAPRRFKSAYMFYSTQKHKDLREELSKRGQRKIKTTEVAKMVSKAWKTLPSKERNKWEKMAREDKKRYEAERAAYRGPWKIPAIPFPRAHKDPSAPKRPMSAFLVYSNAKRKKVKQEYPALKNSDISRVLARMWKRAPAEERKEYQDEELRLRREYKSAVVDWRRKKDVDMKVEQERTIMSSQSGESDIGITNSLGALVSAVFDSSEGLEFETREESISEYSTKMASETFGETLCPPHSPSQGSIRSIALHSFLEDNDDINQQPQPPPPTYHDSNLFSYPCTPFHLAHSTNNTNYAVPSYEMNGYPYPSADRSSHEVRGIVTHSPAYTVSSNSFFRGSGYEGLHVSINDCNTGTQYQPYMGHYTYPDNYQYGHITSNSYPTGEDTPPGMSVNGAMTSTLDMPNMQTSYSASSQPHIAYSYNPHFGPPAE